ncbi:flavodoxin [Flavobacterium agrisoli]|uniref:NAD(P)H-dependent oxidoreductase n=1 Tax=Flavobacterium agrisoli TaxID=2793066 RepID=A0A934PLQ4_9FLAO|nr:flavodoxin [Flavobacterium agrisoli]MBK0368683.1 NAD(P)H-dependent oxidoreductase [Flavobacterium agrisoli]
MKKIKNIAGLVITVCLFWSCSQAQNAPDEALEPAADKKILIVYLSRTNNTKAIAEMIQKYVDGDLAAVELQTPYPENYTQTVDQVAKENAAGYLPPLKTKIADIEKYDVIFFGFPTWGMQLPPPMKSFLSQYQLKGKTIIPFNTNAGYGVGSGFRDVKKLSPDSNILEGFTIEGGKEKDGVLFVMEGNKQKKAQEQVESWLRKISML